MSTPHASILQGDLQDQKTAGYQSALGVTRTEIIPLPGIRTQSGFTFEKVDVCFQTLGTLSPARYNAILVCGIAFLLWTYLFDRLPAGIAGLGTLAVPVIGITVSRFQFGEEIGFWEGWGIALILAGLALLSIIRLREARPADPVLGQD